MSTKAHFRTQAILTDSHQLILTLGEQREEAQIVQVKLGGGLVEGLLFDNYSWPSVAMNQETVLLWANCEFYALSPTDGLVGHHETSESILAIQPIDQGWCCVCEASVLLFRDVSNAPSVRFDHGEVFLDYAIDASLIRLVDLEGNKITLRMTLDPEIGLEQVGGSHS